MSTYFIEFNKGLDQVSSLDSAGKALSNYAHDLQKIVSKNNRNPQLNLIMSSLKYSGKVIAGLGGKLTQASIALDEISTTYLAAEKQVYQNISNVTDTKTVEDMRRKTEEMRERYEKYKDISFLPFMDGFDFVNERGQFGDAMLFFGNDMTRAGFDLFFGRSNRGEYIKDSLRNLFNNMRKSNSTYDKMEDYIFRSGSATMDVLDGLLDESDKFLDLNASFSLLKHLRKSGELGEHISSVLAGEYAQNIAFLDSMEEAFRQTGDTDMLRAIKELRAEYNGEFAENVKQIAAYATAEASEIVLNELLPPYAIIDTVRGFIYDTTGLTEYTNNLQDLYANLNYAGYMANNFAELKLKIISGDYTPADMQQFEAAFETTKAVYIEQYRLMIELTNDKNEKAALTSKLNELQNMTLSGQSNSFGGGGGGRR